MHPQSIAHNEPNSMTVDVQPTDEGSAPDHGNDALIVTRRSRRRSRRVLPPHYVVHVDARFLVDGARTPEQALDWVNARLSDPNVDLHVTSFGHVQRVVLADEIESYGTGQPAFEVANGNLTVVRQWSPAAWPAVTCTPRGIAS
jgi:hypothetical protein